METDDSTLLWPPGVAYDDDEVVGCCCSACARTWRIHNDLAGYRLRCHCGAWIDVPRTLAKGALLAGPSDEAGALAPWIAHQTTAAVEPLTIPAPGASAAAPLESAAPEVKKRWLSRTVWELAALVGAFWLPAFAIQLSMTGSERALWMPVASLAASAVVLLVGIASPRFAFTGLRSAPMRHLFEAVFATAGFLLVAFGLQAVLRGASPSAYDDVIGQVLELGLPMALLSIAVVPALFEELAFRGLLQTRFELLYGPHQAVLLTGTAFGLAHGITLALPLHFALGFYLGWLRLRSGSLIPGMLLHFLYNATLVVATYTAT